MNRRLRGFLFWVHLSAGIFAGVIILVMSATGALLAFETELVAWSQREVSRVDPPADRSARLPLAVLIQRARETVGGGVPIGYVHLSSDPCEAVKIHFGRGFGVCNVNPYTGEAVLARDSRMARFMRATRRWHRWLALDGGGKETGRAITGAGNAIFLGLALSGLVLWWPRKWTRRSIRPLLFFGKHRGRARDWNWHHVVGIWCLPPILVMSATGIVISYDWAHRLVFAAFGEAPPARGGPAVLRGGLAAAEIEVSEEGQPRLPFEDIFASAAASCPGWVDMTIHDGLPRRGGGAAAMPVWGKGSRSGGAEPYVVLVRGTGAGPAFASDQLVFHPRSGALLSRSNFADRSTATRVRAWIRHLHTGHALGWPGQTIALLACLGACLLVYTGFALAVRRLISKV